MTTLLPQRHGRTERLIRTWGTLLAVVTLVLMYGPFLIAHVHNSSNPFIFANDVRPWIVPFVVSGYASEYYASTLSPLGYKAFYQTVALVVDPTVVSKVLPYPLLLAVLGGVWAAAGRLGGVAASFSAAALCLSTSVFLSMMGGGTPRAFGFPLMVAAAVALIFGRTLWLAALVVISAALYPPIAVVTGLALSFETLLLPTRDRGDTREWALSRRMLLVAATALGAVLILAPALTTKGYGPRLTLHDITVYPEAGPGGRYAPEDRPPFDDFWTDLRRATRETLRGTGRPWSSRLRALSRPWAPRLELAVLAGIVLGLGSLAARTSAARRLLILGVAAAVAHMAARLLAPHLYVPWRYALYPMSILIVIGLPVAAGVLPALFRRLTATSWLPSLATLTMTAACLVLLGARGDERAGLNGDYRQDTRIFAFLRRLPDVTLVAGWPDEHGILDSIPYLTRHQAFLTYETHLAYHRGYLDEMRRRMRALIDAVFATDPTPLVHLRDDWGVTHLIVDRRYYGPSPPTYFKPYDAWIRAAVERGQGAGFEILRHIEAATVFSQETLVVLDLRQLVVPRKAPQDRTYDKP